jgi:hypothetical protein
VKIPEAGRLHVGREEDLIRAIGLVPIALETDVTAHRHRADPITHPAVSEPDHRRAEE